MTYEVIRTINGRRYRYRQRSYRQDGKVKTESEYLGPEDGGVRRKRSAIGALLGELGDMAKSKKEWAESEEQMLDRVARESAQYKLNASIGKTLMEGPSLRDLERISAIQQGRMELQEVSPREWALMPSEPASPSPGESPSPSGSPPSDEPSGEPSAPEGPS